MTRPLTALLTHENPDLDATLSLWLLKRFGREKYPGVEHLPVMYLPAGVTPGNRHPDELERTEGILAVDTGGGRLDTHARDGVFDERKRDKSAALLVAEDLGVDRRPELEKILQFVTLQEIRGRSIASSHPMDHLVSLPNLVRGLNIRYAQDPQRVTALVHELYDAAFSTELEWFQALEDFKKASVVTLSSQARLVAIHSDTSAALKVARLNRGDLIIHRNSAGQTGITARNNGLLSSIDLAVVAEVVRVAEAIVAGEAIEYHRLRELGTVHGWYLHDSGKILSKGSPKNREVPPSQLALIDLLEMVRARLDALYPMPDSVCGLLRTSDGGACGRCPLEPLALQSCASLRGQYNVGERPGF